MFNKASQEKMKNIANISTNKLNMACIYYPGLGDWRGGAAGLKNMLYIFNKLGIETTNVTSYDYDSTKFHIEHKRINPSLKSTTIHFPSYMPKVLKAFSVVLGFIYAWSPIKRSNLILAHLSLTSAIPAVVLGRIYDKPVIFHYIDAESLPVPTFVYRYIFKRAAIIFAISPYLMDKAKGYGSENVVYLPAFVDTELFKIDMNARKEKRDDLNIKDSDIVIGYMGSFSYIEGIPFLLQAFKNLLKRHSNIRMIIVGGVKNESCDDVPKLVKDLNIENKVTIVPPQPHEAIPKFLSACDITCSPKIDCEENRAAHPIKVVEYLSIGLPTVCSAVGGITYTIDDGIDGLLVKPGDVKDLEEKLNLLISNHDRMKEIGEKGRKKAIHEYSFTAIGNKVKESIREFVTQKNGNRGG